MKKIITIIFTSAMMLIGSQAHAQISVGAGYANSMTRTKVGSNITTVPSNGVYAGIDYNITEGNGGGISVGANFSYLIATKSGKGSFAGINLGGKATVEEMYLDIPVNFNYSMPLGNDMKAFIFAGPTFSLGLSSTIKGEGSILGISVETGKRDNYADEDYNRFDILLGGGIGVDYGQLRFKLGYNAGMLNRYNAENFKQTRNLLQLGVAFLF